MASNATAKGRAKNRRVDFRIAEITSVDDGPQTKESSGDRDQRP